MSDDPLQNSKPESKRLFEWLLSLFSRRPQDREQLVGVLRDAEDRELIDGESLSMIESTMQLSQMQVRDIMVPLAQMAALKREGDIETFIKTAVDSGHSRFPVWDEEGEKIIGILLAKDLLSYFENELRQTFQVNNILRQAFFVPESKRLDSLLREFRITHNHMAVVIDEYGNVAGLVTIEDVLEQIVGDIEDEHDVEEEEDAIKHHPDGHYTVKAQTTIEDFNDYFKVQLSDEAFDTIGGLVLQKFGRLPKRGESVSIDHFHFTVLSSDQRRLKLLELRLNPS